MVRVRVRVRVRPPSPTKRKTRCALARFGRKPFSIGTSRSSAASPAITCGATPPEAGTRTPQVQYVGGKPPCTSGTYATRTAGTRDLYVPYGGPWGARVSSGHHQEHSAREKAECDAGSECKHEEGQHRRHDVQQAEEEVAGRGQCAIVLGLVVPRHSPCAVAERCIGTTCGLWLSRIAQRIENVGGAATNSVHSCGAEELFLCGASRQTRPQIDKVRAIRRAAGRGVGGTLQKKRSSASLRSPVWCRRRSAVW